MLLTLCITRAHLKPWAKRRIELRAGFLTLLFSLLPVQSLAEAPEHGDIRLNRCLDEIDFVSLQYDAGNTSGAEEQLNALMNSCSHVPQLHHNLGVIATAGSDWKTAISHFEQSLALDERAAMTQRSLSSIYQFKASRAYKKALNLSEKIKLPVVAMQTSALTNLCRADYAPSSPQAETTVSKSIPPAETGIDREQLLAAVSYDVESWWTALLEQDDAATTAHYVEGYQPKVPVDQRVTIPWSDVTVAIDFVDHVALVSLAYSAPDETSDDGSNTRHHDVLLVMKEHNRMWKIVREQHNS